MSPDTFTARLDAWASRLSASEATVALRTIDIQDARFAQFPRDLLPGKSLTALA